MYENGDSSKEFIVSAELYISKAAGDALRKPAAQPQKKRLDKRESSTGLVEDNRLKEKSSWLALTRGLGGVGQWRSATCRLTEEGDRCLLNVYVDDSILYQTVYVHLLHQTDIRQTDSSLFFRKECLGIYCIDGQRWNTAPSAEPIYLQFLNTEMCHTWLALLKSYAIPEIYGRWFSSDADGGSYRMWRQVELQLIQGRNLGMSKYSSDTRNRLDGADSTADMDVVDMDVSCEIYLSDILCGRTTVKKGIGSPYWHEMFTFTDLPPFENLDVIVWREKLFKPSTLGSVKIPLGSFRRGEAIEGWFPVLQAGPPASDLQVGELRLRIRVDEEIILPNFVYSGLLKVLYSRNVLDWMTNFETELNLRTVSTQFMAVAIANNTLIEQVQDFASRNMDNATSSHQTIFRGNSVLTKVMESCMAWYGKPFLEASIGTVLRRLCAEKIVIEVDPAKSGKSSKDVERNIEQLIYWCQEFWNQIYSVRAQCPQEMRRLFETIRKLVEKRYNSQTPSLESNKDLRWQSVSAFCFLRFIVPAILNPHLFGLCPGLPSIPVQRSLKLIAKVIQSLANLNAGVQKETFMGGVKDFLKDSHPAMIDYLLVVSTPGGSHSSYTGEIADRHDRREIASVLKQRKLTMRALASESIPPLPHLIDVPRQLATITSAVIRHSRDSRTRTKPQSVGEKPVDAFCSKCFEVEEHALLRVSQLASKLSSGGRRQSTSGSPVSPSSSRSPAVQPSSPLSTSNSKPKSRRVTRPSTAPSPSESNSPRSNPFAGSNTRFFTKTEQPSGNGVRSNTGGLHMKSPSSDSVPSAGASESKQIYQDRRIEPIVDIADDGVKRKRKIFGGILRR